MTKLKAALIHLFISINIVGILIIVIYYIWYPKPLLDISNVIEPIKILILVDIIIGPILTFIVYNDQKKSLKVDLSIIAIIQLLAFIYGAHTIYQGRASLLVFNNGELIYLEEVYAKNDQLKVNELKPHLFSAPKYAFIETLNPWDIYQNYSGFKAIDDFDQQIKPSSYDAKELINKFPEDEDQINDLIKKYSDDTLYFLKLNKRYTDFYYVLYSQNKSKIIDMLDLEQSSEKD